MEPEPSSRAPAPPSDGSLPTRVGRYRVLGRLATGGTSDVLLAEGPRPSGVDGLVVLKLLLQELRDDEQFERMFTREAAAYRRLRHPAVVELYDFFSDGDELVMVLEHVDGMPLHKLRALTRKGSALPNAATAYLCSRVFDALAAAHAAVDPDTGLPSPVIHRDVNPSNVLLPWDGRAKIADFGIAKVGGFDHDKTQAGFIKGTYGYMAPEQVRAEPLSERADVYAASLLAWELLVGRKAIVRGRGTDLDVLRLMAEPSYPSLASLRPDLPSPILNAVACGLEPRPSRRTITAAELAAVLRATFDLEAGRERLAEVLGRLRPAPSPDDLALTIERRPAESVSPRSADATIPDLPSLPDPTLLPPLLAAPVPAPTPPPRQLTSAPRLSSAAAKSLSASTLLGIAPSRPSAPPLPLPPPPPALELPALPPPSARTPPAPPSARTSAPPLSSRTPPPPPSSGRPPSSSRTPPPLPRPSLTPSPPALPVGAPRTSAPPPLPIARASAPPPVTLSPLPPPLPPPRASLPPAAAPWVANTPEPPVDPAPAEESVPWAKPQSQIPTVPPRPLGPTLPDEASRSRTTKTLLVVAALVLAVGALAVVAWARGGAATAYVPPVKAKAAGSGGGGAQERASARVSPGASVSPSPGSSPRTSASATPTPSATLSPSASVDAGSARAVASLGAGEGTVTAAKGGHRVWVDKQLVGESPGTFTVRCGVRTVQVGSQGQPKKVSVPCGGDVDVK